ncbi:MAG: A/G-specific adenine glycosylase, partial [Bacteroidales bacterium]|nr:A/G-specific adenine glycosylase [Bacteroidales bacterium]
MKDTALTKKLISWYQVHKRDLPWRGTSDPYKIWVSEIILQQTRIEQGRDYFLRFVKFFPDVFSLANASRDEVMKQWQGLGYYSRANNMHETAKT